MLRYAKGDVAAFDTLFNRHNGGVYRFFNRQKNASSHAEELAQEVWASVINAAEHYEVTAKFNTWLYRIAHNRLIDHVRAIGARLEVCYGDPPEDVEDVAIPEYQIPERMAERQQLAEEMLRAISELPPEQAEVFLMHQEGDLTLEEMAAAIGVGRETVKSRLRYALGKLRSRLSTWR